jgi:hypothetical protein
MDSNTLGQPVFVRTFDSGYVSGWGTRPYSWSLGATVQQEIVPRVSVNVGYYRNWWGNWYVVDNRSTSLADYTPFSIAAPVDPRLPNGGGYTIGGLYNLVPERVGEVDEIATASNNYAKQIENWQGVDVGVVARLRNGLTLQAGTSTGRRYEDACALKAAVPEQGEGPTGRANTSIAGGSVENPYCKVVEPYRTDFRGLATYTIPLIDVQVSGTWRSIPGNDLSADFVANNAWIAAGPQPLGRPLSGSNSVTVNLIPPHTVYADRQNTIDFRFAKILRFGNTRTQVGLDVYNLMNNDVITGFNERFVPNGSWLRPEDVMPARYARISAQIDF